MSNWKTDHNMVSIQYTYGDSLLLDKSATIEEVLATKNKGISPEDSRKITLITDNIYEFSARQVKDVLIDALESENLHSYVEVAEKFYDQMKIPIGDKRALYSSDHINSIINLGDAMFDSQ